MDNEIKMPMAKSLQQVIGSLLFASDHPLTAEEIRVCLKNVAKESKERGEENETVQLFANQPLREVKDAIGDIQKELSRLDLGFELVETSAGFHFQSQPAGGRWVRNLLKMDRPNRLSHPALETLAIIAYRQPIAKSEIEGLRGVDAGHIVKSLMELHLIRIVGRSELPGRPFLYGTTTTFLDHFGLSTLKELNELDPTLQRSKPSERKAAHTKKKKEEPAPDAPVQMELTEGKPEQKTEKKPQANPDTEGIREVLGDGKDGENEESVFEETGDNGEEA